MYVQSVGVHGAPFSASHVPFSFSERVCSWADEEKWVEQHGDVHFIGSMRHGSGKQPASHPASPTIIDGREASFGT